MFRAVPETGFTDGRFPADSHKAKSMDALLRIQGALEDSENFVKLDKVDVLEKLDVVLDHYVLHTDVRKHARKCLGLFFSDKIIQGLGSDGEDVLRETITSLTQIYDREARGDSKKNSHYLAETLVDLNIAIDLKSNWDAYRFGEQCIDHTWAGALCLLRGAPFDKEQGNNALDTAERLLKHAVLAGAPEFVHANSFYEEIAEKIHNRSNKALFSLSQKAVSILGIHVPYRGTNPDLQKILSCEYV